MANATISFVDVGQGHCTVGVDPQSGEALMVDCPSGGRSEALSVLRKHGATGLNVVIASHQHLDHLGGVVGVVTDMPTRELRINPPTHVPADREDARKLRATLRAIHGLPRRGVALGDARQGDEGTVGQLQWQIIAPDRGQLFRAAEISDANHASAVVSLSVGDYKFLLGGDADAQSWWALLERGEEVAADVFQVPHHGAEMLAGPGRVSMGELIQRVGAELYVISVGSRNGYGHPASSTLATIGNMRNGSALLCTQLNEFCAGCAVAGGTSCAEDITIRVDPDGLKVSPDPTAHRRAVSGLPQPQCV